MRHTGNRSRTVGDIQKVGVRAALPVRNEPYWRHIRPRCSLGFRKGLKVSTWKARYHDDKGEQIYKSLGADTELDYAGALTQAEAWWSGLGAGVSHRTLTVEDAVKKYADHREAMRGEDAGERDRRQFKQVLFNEKLAKIELDKLRAQDIEEWRNGLVTPERSKQTANRIYRSFRAAMNYAFKQRMIALRPWDAVDAFPVREGSRQTYLSLDERRAILEASCPELRTFLTALLYTGARPGEMERAKVRDLDLQSKTLKLVSSKGHGGQERVRHFPLAGASLEFFRKLAEGKAKGDPLAVPAGWSRTQWSRALRAAGSGVVCYDMRHIAISDWLQAGVDIGTVAKLAGTSVLMVDRHYSKFIKTAVQDKLATVTMI